MKIKKIYKVIAVVMLKLSFTTEKCLKKIQMEWSVDHDQIAPSETV